MRVNDATTPSKTSAGTGGISSLQQAPASNLLKAMDIPSVIKTLEPYVVYKPKPATGGFKEWTKEQWDKYCTDVSDYPVVLMLIRRNQQLELAVGAVASTRTDEQEDTKIVLISPVFDLRVTQGSANIYALKNMINQARTKHEKELGETTPEAEQVHSGYSAAQDYMLKKQYPDATTVISGNGSKSYDVHDVLFVDFLGYYFKTDRFETSPQRFHF
ncbi:MAG: hypothetical protein HYY52_03080 [Candidatus Melainabacteria bacterium]|nr:hypothetical protein [Candidatus Melainabacteria bacterium]